MKRSLIILGLIVVAGCGGCSKQQETVEPPAPKVTGGDITFVPDSPQMASLNAEVAEPRKWAVTHLTGRLYWNDDATVRIFTPVAGRVTSILAKLGEQVSAGTALAEIDSPDFGQALADARTAEGNLRQADKALARAKELFEHGAAAQKDVENAEAANVSASAERDRAVSRLLLYGGNEASTNEQYLLRSPIAGELVERNINPGQEVRADQMLANATQLFAPLFVVSDPTRLWLQLDVTESDVASLQVGQHLKIFSRAFPGREFDGTVENIGDALDPATRAVKVRGVVNNSDKLLKAEMYVTVDAVTDESHTADAGVEIPAKAVFMRADQYYLFVEKSPGEFERHHVKVGAERDGKVPVFDGVQPGQKVVTDGCLLLESLVEAGDQS